MAKKIKKFAGGGVYKNRRAYGQDPRDETTLRYVKDRDGLRMHPDDFQVMKDISARDDADIERGKPSGILIGPIGADDPSVADQRSRREAIERQNRLGVANEGFNEDTGKGYTVKEGNDTRKRLLKRYGVETKAKGGAVKTYAKGGSVKSSASKRGDGIAQRGKTRGKIC